MAKLALFCFDNDTPRILDTDEHSLGYEWDGGRNPKRSIYFTNPYISNLHFLIRCINEHDIDQWQIKHVGRHNTYRFDHGIHSMLPPDEWVNIRDDNVFHLVTPDCGFRATTDVGETLGLLDDETPTVNETADEAEKEDADWKITIFNAVWNLPGKTAPAWLLMGWRVLVVCAGVLFGSLLFL